jgi:hypothetical protein
MKKIVTKFMCWLAGHAWTCKAEQGIPPAKMKTFEELSEYAKMYCNRCGKQSELNKRFR